MTQLRNVFIGSTRSNIVELKEEKSSKLGKCGKQPSGLESKWTVHPNWTRRCFIDACLCLCAVCTYGWKLCLAKHATNVHFPCCTRYIHSNTPSRGLLLEVFFVESQSLEDAVQRRRLNFFSYFYSHFSIGAVGFFECHRRH